VSQLKRGLYLRRKLRPVQQRPIPPRQLDRLQHIADHFPDFLDDGCTSAPDKLLGYDFKWACRLHDFAYCSHAHAPGTMNLLRKAMADAQLFYNVQASLPGLVALRVAAVYFQAVMELGGDSYGSCTAGPNGRCRHNLRYSAWLKGTK